MADYHLVILTPDSGYKIGIFFESLGCSIHSTMKTPFIASALLFASVSLFAVGNVGVTPGPTTPTTPVVPVVKPPCTKPGSNVPVTPKVSEKKGDDKKNVEKKHDDKKHDDKKRDEKKEDTQRPFKK